MSRRVFVVNCGSSSLKYSLLEVDAGEALGSGLADRVGRPGSRLVHRGPAGEETVERPLRDHAEALAAVLETCRRLGPALDDLVAIAHRVVHGGDRFAAPTLIDDDVLAAVRELGVLAPLHNPVNATGIEVARRAFPQLPHVAIFDTAFHQTLPPHAYTYAVPREWQRRHAVRRYGFHGTSHAFVSRAAAGLLGRDPRETHLIVLHLGNGASATAVAGGISVDTSMGLTPLEGLVMGTRSGDVDPAVVWHMHRVADLDEDAIAATLNGASGLLALAGDGDMREVHRRVAAGDEAAALALEVYCYRIRKYVGAYLAALGGAHAIAFTAGVGENDAVVRAKSLAGLETLGIAVDPARNAERSSAARVISPPGAQVAVLVVPTDEELEMATQALALVGGR